MTKDTPERFDTGFRHEDQPSRALGQGIPEALPRDGYAGAMELDVTTLRQPAVVAAFRGWNDAGEAATSVIRHLVLGNETHEVLVFDEGYYDLRQSRPIVGVHDGKRVLKWPNTTIAICRTAQRDLLIVVGDEPNFDWPDLCQEILGTITLCEATPVVVLGSMNSDDPHSRPLPVSIDATNPDLVWGMGAESSDYTGPTGITGVLSLMATEAGLDVVSMWVSTPSYTADDECAKATLALARRVSEVLGVDFDWVELEKSASEWERQISELVESDPDMARYVDTLESLKDTSLAPPSGEDQAAPIEEYLREGDASS